MNSPEAISQPPEQIDFSNCLLTQPKEQFDRDFMEVYQKDLFPYSDDSFLRQRLAATPRVFRNFPELHEEVAIAISGDDDESILRVVADLADARRAIDPVKKPINEFVSFLTIVDTITNHQERILGPDSSPARANAIIRLAANELIRDIPDALLADATYSAGYLTERANRIFAQTGNWRYGQMVGKMQGLAIELQRRSMASRYIEALPGEDSDFVSTETVQEDSARIQELFTEVVATRQYGLKMAYTPDQWGGSIVFGEPVDLRDAFGEQFSDIHELVARPTAIADIIHSSIAHPRRPRMSISITELQGTTGSTDIATIDLATLQPLSLLQLGKDGELYIDRDCAMPYVTIAQEKGKYTSYRALQASILARYFDLTHAIDSTAPSTSEARLIHEVVEKDPRDSIEKLLVPRLRRYHTPQKTGVVIEDEVPKRSVRHHDVIWHVRALPDGWHASPAAIERAETLGVTLGTNETLVKAYKRGNEAIGQVLGHRLVTLEDEHKR